MKRLGIIEKLTDLGFSTKQRSLAVGAIVARLLAPGSDRSSFSWLQDHSALGELIEFDYNLTNLNHFYKIADQLLDSKTELERFLYQKEQTLFELDESIVLYDLTNTFFKRDASSHLPLQR